MRLVVDTNVFISALVKDAMARKLVTHLDAELLTIGLVKEEIAAHEKELVAKTHVTSEELWRVLDCLFDRVVILNDQLVQSKMPEAKRIMDSIDRDDTPFIAAALATESAVWSDDAHFQKQDRIKVYRTRDLAEHLARAWY